MKADFKTEEQAAVASDAEKLINSGADNEIVLGLLRERGFDKLDSIKAIVNATGMSLGEAKKTSFITAGHGRTRLLEMRSSMPPCPKLSRLLGWMNPSAPTA
jgi:hypothetical protein